MAISHHTYICIDCDKEFTCRNPRPPEKRRCPTCSIEHMRTVCLQLHNKSGPYYDKWLAAMDNFGRDRQRAALAKRRIAT